MTAAVIAALPFGGFGLALILAALWRNRRVRVRRPTPTELGRMMAKARHDKDRNRVIAKANEMRERMGMPPIPRRGG